VLYKLLSKEERLLEKLVIDFKLSIHVDLVWAEYEAIGLKYCKIKVKDARWL